MKDFTDGLQLLAIVLVFWHGKIAYSSETQVTGFFQESPEPGYVWKETGTTETIYFFQNNDVVWMPGIIHPQYNVKSTENENNWLPLPGYVWDSTNQEGDLYTVWKPGIQYPNFKAIAAATEGRWNPVIGYKFVVDENGNWTDVIWNPGYRYPDLKIISGTQPDTFIPFDGYRFLNKENADLRVVWTPGSKSEGRPNQIAGDVEGSWIAESTEAPIQPFANAASGYALAKAIEWIFGENYASDYIKQESSKEALRGLFGTPK